MNGDIFYLSIIASFLENAVREKIAKDYPNAYGMVDDDLREEVARDILRKMLASSSE